MAFCRSLSARPLKEYGIFLLSLGFSNPSNSFWTATISLIVIQTFSAFYFYHAYIDLIELEKIELLPKRVFILLVFGQVLFQNTMLYLSRRNILELLDDQARFWKSSKIAQLQIDESNYRSYLCFSSLMFNGFVSFTFFTAQAFYANELLFGQRIPKGSEHDHLYILADMFTLALNMFTFFGLLTLYTALLYELIAQFIILNDALRNCDGANFSRYIKHHVFLLRYAKRLNNLLTWPLLSVTIFVTITACVEAFFCTFKTTTLYERIFHFLILIGAVIMFSFCCIPATELSDEMGTVSTAIGQSNWYDFTRDVRNSMRIMMAQSQVDFHITAGRLFTINNLRLIQVMRLALSLYTLLNHMNEK